MERGPSCSRLGAAWEVWARACRQVRMWRLTLSAIRSSWSRLLHRTALHVNEGKKGSKAKGSGSDEV